MPADDIDTGWDDEEAEPELQWRGLTPEEREVRADRRKARAAIANGKQKQKQKIRRLRKEPEPRTPSRSQVEEPVANGSPREGETRRARSRRNDPRVLAFLVSIVLVAGVVVLFLATRL